MTLLFSSRQKFSPCLFGPIHSCWRVLLIAGQRLRLKSVTVEDESEFMCRVENPGGFLESTAILRIIPGTPPVFTQNFDLLNR